MTARVCEVVFSEKFKSDWKSLPDEAKAEAAEALRMLRADPMPKWIRFEKLHGYRPGIFTIHATRNHAYKISFELRGTVACLRRIGTHKMIDKTP